MGEFGHKKVGLKKQSMKLELCEKPYSHEQRTLVRVRVKNFYRSIMGAKAGGICDNQTMEGLVDRTEIGNVFGKHWGIKNRSSRVFAGISVAGSIWPSGLRSVLPPQQDLLRLKQPLVFLLGYLHYVLTLLYFDLVVKITS